MRWNPAVGTVRELTDLDVLPLLLLLLKSFLLSLRLSDLLLGGAVHIDLFLAVKLPALVRLAVLGDEQAREALALLTYNDDEYGVDQVESLPVTSKIKRCTYSLCNRGGATGPSTQG